MTKNNTLHKQQNRSISTPEVRLAANYAIIMAHIAIMCTHGAILGEDTPNKLSS